MLDNEMEATQSHNRSSELEDAGKAILPAGKADRGDAEIASFNYGTVYFELKGTCLSCPSSEMAIKLGIERTLKELMHWVKRAERCIAVPKRLSQGRDEQESSCHIKKTGKRAAFNSPD